MIGQSLGKVTIVVVTLLFVTMSLGGEEKASTTVRPAYCAGGWYPGTAEALAKEVNDLLAKAAPPGLSGKPIAVIAPHAGYRFSAPTAAAGYKCLQGHAYKRVIVLAFSHTRAGTYQGVDVPDKLTAYHTPLGDVPIDREICDALLRKPGFAPHPGIDRGEHSLELQLPFLQRVLKGFRLVPLLVGRMSQADETEAARAILPYLDDDTLLVASTDFTHFGLRFGYQPFKDDVPNKLRELADRAVEPILKADYDGFVKHLDETGDTICGRGPVRLLLRILSMRGGASGVRTAFDTSGNLTGGWSNSVTYQSIVLTRVPGTLGSQEQAELLRLARQTVTAHLNSRELPKPDKTALPPALRQDGACFVTLENRGRLRGCIGNMQATGPLYQAVIHNAVSACQDYRFVQSPVTAGELDQIDIEISYLTPMKPVSKPGEIIVGRHGLHISLGGRRGVLLPQVAYERGWAREEFLAQVCRKAGLPLDAWKRPEAQIQCFTAEVFGE
ncbi:MAG: AmmeMemoRadiSam system protein B [Phycisphaerae bacterium]|nr:AmmeMemoRadiSam system protein B [Phycisphaerae bacterium]